MRLSYNNISFVKEVRERESNNLVVVHVVMKGQAVSNLRTFKVNELTDLPKCVLKFIMNHYREIFNVTETKVTHIFRSENKVLTVDSIMGMICDMQHTGLYSNTDALKLLDMIIIEHDDNLFSTEFYDYCCEYIENNAVFVDGILKVV